MEQRISIERMEQAVNLFGSFDENVRLIESEFKVTISNREGELRVNGEVEDTVLATKALNALLTLSNRGEPITEQNVRYVISLVRAGQEERISELTQDVICISSKGRPIKPKTIGQKKYIESVLKNTITIGVGPAGTGKTYLAVAAAVAAFRERKINRIILTRPAVEAGERCVIAVGGDGTVNEVASVLVNTGVVMGVLPFGTGNDLARVAGFPEDPEAAVDTLLAGRTRRMDAGMANDRFFLNVSGFGFDVDVLVNTERYKEKYNGMLPYPVSYTHLTLPTNREV